MLIVLFSYTGVQHDFRIRWCSSRFTVTRLVPLVEQEPLTFPQHMSSPAVFSLFVGVLLLLYERNQNVEQELLSIREHIPQSLVFCVSCPLPLVIVLSVLVFCRSLYVPFPLAIVLSIYAFWLHLWCLQVFICMNGDNICSVEHFLSTEQCPFK